jgi:anaerobic magnesium-protoporphyrin IX monomethyl ester cyclase
MKVMLVDLENRSDLLKVPLWMPVYLPSLAAVLRQDGHGVTILELAAAVPWRCSSGAGTRAERLAAAILKGDPDLVIFDVRMEHWGSFVACAKATRAVLPSVMIVAGGRHASLCPEDILHFCSALDGVLIGEAEHAVRALAGGTPPSDVPAMAVRQNDVVRRTSNESMVVDLDSLPFPAWDLLDMAYHTLRTPRVIPCIPLKTATLESSRGCSGQCAFCSEGRLYSKTHRFHSAGYVADAVERLVRDYAIDGLYFSDEAFTTNAARVAALCEEFIRRWPADRIRWSAQVRSDSVSTGMLALMRRAGCIQLEFGIESGSPRMLGAMAKGTSVEQNAAALRMTREAGIRSLAYIVIGLPGETREDLLQTRRFLDSANPDIVRINPFILFPGTPAVSKLINESRLSPDFWKDERTAWTSRSSERANVSAMTLADLNHVGRDLVRHAGLSRFIRDYAAHNRLRDVPMHFNVGMLPGFFWKRIFG